MMTTATVTKDAKAVASAYFEAWKARDFDTFRFLLTDEVEFVGPLAHLHNADDCVKGIKGMSEMITDIVVHKVLADAEDMITWFDLACQGASSCRRPIGAM
ncbi:MAG: nuclear transport factor 2 family protein [Thermomicrobiales bacterium]